MWRHLWVLSRRSPSRSPHAHRRRPGERRRLDEALGLRPPCARPRRALASALHRRRKKAASTADGGPADPGGAAASQTSPAACSFLLPQHLARDHGGAALSRRAAGGHEARLALAAHPRLAGPLLRPDPPQHLPARADRHPGRAAGSARSANQERRPGHPRAHHLQRAHRARWTRRRGSGRRERVAHRARPSGGLVRSLRRGPRSRGWHSSRSSVAPTAEACSCGFA